MQTILKTINNNLLAQWRLCLKFEIRTCYTFIFFTRLLHVLCINICLSYNAFGLERSLFELKCEERVGLFNVVKLSDG